MRVVVGALIALTLGLACTVMWAAVLLAPSSVMTGMPDMDGMDGMNGMGGGPVAAMTTSATNQVVDAASDAGHAVMSTCTSACVDDVADACTLGVSLAVVTILALLLGTRRDTFLGLLARPRVVLLARRPRWSRSPWTVLSLSTLCVLRV